MSSTAATHRIPPFTLFARMRTWWIILRISIEERLVYRGEFMLGTLMRFLPVITQIFFWAAVFSPRRRRFRDDFGKLRSRRLDDRRLYATRTSSPIIC